MHFNSNTPIHSIIRNAYLYFSLLLVNPIYIHPASLYGTPGNSRGKGTMASRAAPNNRRVSTPSVALDAIGVPLSANAHAAGSGGASSIYDRSVQRKRGEVSLSAFSLVFGEAIQYAQQKSKGVSELEGRLNKLGFHVGLRMLELIVIRERSKAMKRETRVMGILQFVHTQVWQALFGKSADSMQLSEEDPNQYMIIDLDPKTSTFMSVPKDLPGLSCEALTAGIVQGVFSSAGFPARVTAHAMETPEHPNRTVYVVNFEDARR